MENDGSAAEIPTDQSARLAVENRNSSSSLRLYDPTGCEVTAKSLAAAAEDRRMSALTTVLPLPPLGSREYPYLSKPDGSWVCRFCHSLPDFVPGKSTWKSNGGSPPPALFVNMHMSVCPGSYSHFEIQQIFGHTTIIGMPAAGCQGQTPKSYMTAQDLKNETFECYYCGARFRSWDHCKDHILRHMQHYCPELIGLVELLPEHAVASIRPVLPAGIWPNQMAAPLATMKPYKTKPGPVYWNQDEHKFLPQRRKYWYWCLGCKVPFKKWKKCEEHMKLCCPAALVGKDHGTLLAECQVKPR